MMNLWPRRDFLKLFPLAAAVKIPKFGRESLELSLPERGNPSEETQVNDLFPTQPPELAREMVTVAHFDLKRVKELVEARPSLARAAWDWGFGDWETALGGASHMGNRPIAEYLLSKGAPPSLFSSAMLGHLEVVKAFVSAHPGVQRIRGPHSISLLAHAKAGGDAARPVFEYLQSLGDADADPPVPLSESDANAIKGTYAFGVAANEQIEVTVDKGQATWTRKGMMGRPLFHLGGRVFYPLGAPAVRIRYSEEGTSTIMTVNDPDVVFVARRKV
jgi:hypothetical protein